MQEAAKDAFQKLDHALQIEEHKDVNEGARRRAALGREEPVEDADMSDPEDDVPFSQMFARVAQELAPPPAPTRKRKVNGTTPQRPGKSSSGTARQARAPRECHETRRVRSCEVQRLRGCPCQPHRLLGARGAIVGSGRVLWCCRNMVVTQVCAAKALE